MTINQLLKDIWQDQWDTAKDAGMSDDDADTFARRAINAYAAALLDRADDARDRAREAAAFLEG